ncbi:hypothetical protein KZX45_12490 [Georgenia sp. EYE_87]|uniref:hypothetical protein n=1 Tax=Georgenia sp. EYE_87 TaxID=2853448 RepID=UPI002003EA3F|nr:hypothetical protein [Georgenia sp. EYE_87]MCK6211361.1 hypothetical protein [Georgenia sp. EYE_87]
MPKKRRSSKNSHSRVARPVAIPRIVEAFADMRESVGQDPDDAWIVQPLAELKRDLLGSTDPTVWRADDLAGLLLDVVPRKVHLDAEDRERLVPTLGDFFSFLEASGRWSARSTPRAELVESLAELEPAFRAALADPARRSMGGNIVEFALSEGLDLTDEQGLAAAMDRFNSLSFEERAAVTDTGRLPDGGTPRSTGGAAGQHGPGAAFGLGPGGRPRLSVVPDLDAGDAGWPDEADWNDDEDEVALADIWPEFLGDPIDPDFEPSAASPSELAAALSGTELVRRADLLLDWLGTGRQVTSTGALRQSDTAEVARLLGLRSLSVRSMWEIPELSLLWSALIAAGFLDLGRTVARPAAKAVAWVPAGADDDRRVDAGTLLFGAALSVFLSEQDDGSTMAAMPPLTFLALTKAAYPGGVHLPGPELGSDDVMAILVHADLTMLASAGVLAVDDDRYRFLPQLLPVLDAVMHQLVEELNAY